MVGHIFGQVTGLKPEFTGFEIVEFLYQDIGQRLRFAGSRCLYSEPACFVGDSVAVKLFP